jgi:phage shock protein A
MLDKAEDPEKLIKLMIQEMEDTLVEIKAACAGTMATRSRVSRALDEAKTRAESWGAKAQLALEKGREDLAREALVERRNYQDQFEGFQREADDLGKLVDQYQADIQQLEEKLANTRNKHRLLVQRHIHARKRKRAQTNIRQATNSDAFVRFDQFESRIDRMEADADLVNPAQKPTLEDAFKHLEADDEVERELEALKQRLTGKGKEGTPQS